MGHLQSDLQVLCQGLEVNPRSIELWMTRIELCDGKQDDETEDHLMIKKREIYESGLKEVFIDPISE